MDNCFCGSDSNFSFCCGKFLSHRELPRTPEELMRSRYTAYATGDMDYIQETMRGKAALGFNKLEAKKDAFNTDWLSLEVKNAHTEDTKGFVEFVAHYSHNGIKATIHERSEFLFLDDRWFYVDAKLMRTSNEKVSRNDPCPCASGKKYKKCCGLNFF